MKHKELLERILKYIPSGAQTLSKNPSQFVIGITPPALHKAKGAYVWDLGGRKYLDLLLALGPMVFGYANERIDRRVKEQIDRGTIYSLPSEHELTLAALLRKVVPCAEMSRFVLNGSDATTGAVRLARHITRRTHIAKCGYHGWHDWSICTREGRNTGIPDILSSMTHDFTYNDIDSLQKIFFDYPGKIAAVILEPMTDEIPHDGFLEKVKHIAKKNGALLIFDEMITGFRWALGGAQEYFDVMPDLACFGKAISNGYPLGVICGKREYMSRMDEVFISMTFAGHTLGLVAALECITMMREFGDVHSHMSRMGTILMTRGNTAANEYGVPIAFTGFGQHPVMKVKIEDDYLNRVVKTFIYQEMNRAGVLFSSSMMIGYIHTREHMNFVVQQLESIFSIINNLADLRGLSALLDGEVVAPRTVRNI